jgi:uroporphyrinogen III methyltransferase/synthase
MLKPGPLSGIRVAVTRARAQAEELARPLQELGADVLIAPLIQISKFTDEETVRAAAAGVRDYDWLIFTSANGVELFVQALQRENVTAEMLGPVRVACVGPATAAAAARHGIRTDVMPAEFTGEAVAETLAQRMDLQGLRILLARAHGGGESLPQRLEAQGAAVSDIRLYRSDLDPEGATRLREHIAADLLDVLTFTSGSTVRYFAQVVGTPGRALIAVIGPATAEVATRLGFHVSIEAEPHTTQGLVSGIVRHFAGSPPTGG